jgi:hypothetical protein
VKQLTIGYPDGVVLICGLGADEILAGLELEGHKTLELLVYCSVACRQGFHEHHHVVSMMHIYAHKKLIVKTCSGSNSTSVAGHIT